MSGTIEPATERTELREEIAEAVASVIPDGAVLTERDIVDAVMPVVKRAIWRAANVVRGRCRTCSGILDAEMHPRARDFELGHRMRCRFYVGPLEHKLRMRGINGTFGGTDYDCICGGWFRQGGLAGHGDGTTGAEPICPDADQDWRGPQEGDEAPGGES